MTTGWLGHTLSSLAWLVAWAALVALLACMLACLCWRCALASFSLARIWSLDERQYAYYRQMVEAVAELDAGSQAERTREAHDEQWLLPSCSAEAAVRAYPGAGPIRSGSPRAGAKSWPYLHGLGDDGDSSCNPLELTRAVVRTSSPSSSCSHRLGGRAEHAIQERDAGGTLGVGGAGFDHPAVRPICRELAKLNRLEQSYAQRHTTSDVAVAAAAAAAPVGRKQAPLTEEPPPSDRCKGGRAGMAAEYASGGGLISQHTCSAREPGSWQPASWDAGSLCCSSPAFTPACSARPGSRPGTLRYNTSLQRTGRTMSPNNTHRSAGRGCVGSPPPLLSSTRALSAATGSASWPLNWPQMWCKTYQQPAIQARHLVLPTAMERPASATDATPASLEDNEDVGDGGDGGDGDESGGTARGGSTVRSLRSCSNGTARGGGSSTGRSTRRISATHALIDVPDWAEPGSIVTVRSPYNRYTAFKFRIPPGALPGDTLTVADETRGASNGFSPRSPRRADLDQDAAAQRLEQLLLMQHGGSSEDACDAVAYNEQTEHQGASCCWCWCCWCWDGSCWSWLLWMRQWLQAFGPLCCYCVPCLERCFSAIFPCMQVEAAGAGEVHGEPHGTVSATMGPMEA